MSDRHPYYGHCFCGAIQLEVTAEPEATGYCHCRSCRHWSAAPVNAFMLFKPDDVTVTRGRDRIGSYSRTPQSIRKWCLDCGGHLYTEHPGMGLVDVYAAIIPDAPFAPALHVHYQERVLPIRDGMPKFRDVPESIGGCGEQLAE